MNAHDKVIDGAVKGAAEALAGAAHAVALTGAGLSAASGIATYRGPGGLWTRFGEPPMAQYQAFLNDPAGWWREVLEPTGARAELAAALREAAPNPGHRALAEMEQGGYLQYLITQNVDDLHRRAGSEKVVELHGNVNWLRCVACQRRTPREVMTLEQNALPPRCECGGLIKTDAVMFGEPIPADVAGICEAEVSRCDCMLVAGTSATVFPAAGFPDEVRRRGGTLIEINPHETDLSGDCHIVIRDSTASALPALVAALEDAAGPRAS